MNCRKMQPSHDYAVFIQLFSSFLLPEEPFWCEISPAEFHRQSSVRSRRRSANARSRPALRPWQQGGLFFFFFKLWPSQKKKKRPCKYFNVSNSVQDLKGVFRVAAWAASSACLYHIRSLWCFDFWVAKEQQSETFLNAYGALLLHYCNSSPLCSRLHFFSPLQLEWIQILLYWSQIFWVIFIKLSCK